MATALGAALWVGHAAGLPPSLPAAVPNDIVAAWFVDRTPNHPTPAIRSLNVARFVLDQAGELGLLSQVDPISRAWIDTLSSISLLLDYPHAVAVLEIRSHELADGGHRLESLHGGLIVHCGHRTPPEESSSPSASNDNKGPERNVHAPVEHRIQRLLNSYANRDESRLTTETVQGRTVHRLIDRRLPDWVTISWGAVGDYYVVALGDGSFQRMTEAIEGRGTSLANDDWFVRAFERLGGREAWLAVLVDFSNLHQSTDAALARKAEGVRDALGLLSVERGLWTVRDQDRALQATGLVSVGGEDQLRPLTTGAVVGLSAAQLIPSEATGYAIFDRPPRQALLLFREAYLAARGERARERTYEYWRSLERSAGISIERDVLGNLGNAVMIHDHPQQALRLPFLWTFAAPVAKDPTELRRAIDALFTAWQAELRDGDASMQLRREDDGVWCMFVGINGPAVGMSDDWLVVSFSPLAVRQNLEFLQTVESRPLAERANR